MTDELRPLDGWDFFVGQRVLYRFTPSGGYGFALRVPVTIKRLFAKRAVVLIETANVLRAVSIGSLVKPPTMIGARAEVDLLEKEK